jgi:hypothetical protein
MDQRSYTIKTPQDRPEYRKAFLRMAILDASFYKASLERARIEDARTELDLQTLFADIHFFLVAVANIKKVLKDLKFVLKTDPVLNTIYKQFSPRLEHLNKFRDHLEHIQDGRLDGLRKDKQPLKNPTALGNLYGDTYHFGGEEFNLVESFALIEELQGDLRSWNSYSKIYPLW